MVNFSKYLGKEERVLNSIDMKDETIWRQNNPVATEIKSWTTLVLTNKRFFTLNKIEHSMREFRLEDVVTTGWIYRPQWQRPLWAFVYFLTGAAFLIYSSTLTAYIYEYMAFFEIVIDNLTAAEITFFFKIIGLLFLLFGIIDVFIYFYAKRTTFLMTTKDGREHIFLLRGRRRQIDEFRMAVQDAKDLYIEESENRYFDKMRTTLFDQSNYEYALNNKRPAEKTIPKSKTAELKREEYLIQEQKKALLKDSKNKQIQKDNRKKLGTGTSTLLDSDGTLKLDTDKSMLLDSDGTLKLDTGKSMLLDSDGTLKLDTGKSMLLDSDGTLKLDTGKTNLLDSDGTIKLDADKTKLLDSDEQKLIENGGAYQLEEGDTYPQLKSSASLAESTLRLKAMDLFEKMGYETTMIEEDDADLLLYRDNTKYVVVIDPNDDEIIKQDIDRTIAAKNTYHTNFGVFISMGSYTEEIGKYADNCYVKIIPIQKTEDWEQF